MIVETSRVSNSRREFGLEDLSDRRASTTQSRQTLKKPTLPELLMPKAVTKIRMWNVKATYQAGTENTYQLGTN